MNALSFLGYAIALALAPVAPFIVARWARASWSAAKALRVLLRERRTGETLYDAAEAVAGDAHNWRGLVDVSDAHALTLDGDANVVPASGVRDTEVDVEQMMVRAALSGLHPSCIAERKNLESRLIAPQPPPQNSDGPALWPLIISELGDSETDRLVAIDMQQRYEFGMAKYGVPLVASNGRDHLADAYQEALDGVVYLRAEIENRLTRSVDESGEVSGLHQLYVDLLDIAKELRELIRVRDGR